MRKRTVSGIWHKLSGISLVVIILALMASAAIAIFALRVNNQKMIELRQAVYAADTNNGDVSKALYNLREFVYGHMNTNLRAGSTSTEPPIQLVTRFNIAVAAEQARVAALNNSTKVYSDAQAQCERSSLPLTARAQCIQEYVSTNGSGVQQLNLPPKEFYTFDFASPRWSPDVAGWALVATFLLVVLLVLRIIAGFVVKNYLAAKK